MGNSQLLYGHRRIYHKAVFEDVDEFVEQVEGAEGKLLFEVGGVTGGFLCDRVDLITAARKVS